MQFSVIPFIVVIIFGAMALQVQRLFRQGTLKSAERNWIFTLLVVLLFWGAVSGFLSYTGTYISKEFLALTPGCWLPFVPVVIAFALVFSVAALRDGLRAIIDNSPSYLLTGIHTIRILAIGSLIKAAYGVFPETFAWYVGIPDLIFGASAVPVTLLAWRGRLSYGALLFWHLLGAMVILIPTTGFMHLYMQEPLFTELLVFPMVLAPTLVVPLLVMLNVLVIWRLLEQRWQRA